MLSRMVTVLERVHVVAGNNYDQANRYAHRMEAIAVMHPYLTFDDGTEVVHSDLIHEDGIDKVLVHFERPTESGFDSMRCELPSYTWTPWEGSFSKDELAFFDEFVHSNAALLYC
jgi:hypothetical protein